VTVRSLRGSLLDEKDERLGENAVVRHRVCSLLRLHRAHTASMSGMSIRTATFFGSSGLTNVRMLVTPSGPNSSSRFGEASQCDRGEAERSAPPRCEVCACARCGVYGFVFSRVRASAERVHMHVSEE
jgi:hypothetical protein